jgi:hypothetical protein
VSAQVRAHAALDMVCHTLEDMGILEGRAHLPFPFPLNTQLAAVLMRSVLEIDGDVDGSAAVIVWDEALAGQVRLACLWRMRRWLRFARACAFPYRVYDAFHVRRWRRCVRDSGWARVGWPPSRCHSCLRTSP